MAQAEDHSRSAVMKAIEEEFDGALQQAVDRHEFKVSLIGVLTLLAVVAVLAAAS